MEELINGMGATAELLKLAYESFKAAGFEEARAFELTLGLLKIMVENGKGGI